MKKNVAAWSPWLEKECLKKVQRRDIQMLSNVMGDSYEEKLRDAGLTTLKAQRERGDAIKTFKTINGHNNVEKSEWFLISPADCERPNTRSNTGVSVDGAQSRKQDVILRERELEPSYETIHLDSAQHERGTIFQTL